MRHFGSLASKENKQKMKKKNIVSKIIKPKLNTTKGKKIAKNNKSASKDQR